MAYEVNNPGDSDPVRVDHENGTDTVPPGAREEFRNIQNLAEVVSQCLVKEDGEMVVASDLQEDDESEPDQDQEPVESDEEEGEDSEQSESEESSDEEEVETDEDSGDESDEDESDEEDSGDQAEETEQEASGDPDEEQGNSVDFGELDWNVLLTVAGDNDVEGTGDGRGKDEIIEDLNEISEDELDLSSVK